MNIDIQHLYIPFYSGAKMPSLSNRFEATFVALLSKRSLLKLLTDANMLANLSTVQSGLVATDARFSLNQNRDTYHALIQMSGGTEGPPSPENSQNDITVSSFRNTGSSI